MSVPPFSVVVPLYNKKRYVIDTLRAVLAQTHPADEILVVDDGSTDGGADAVRAAFGDRVRVITQPNQGVAAARNTGLSAARNELVCLLDADDYWEPEYLAEMARLASAFPDAQFYGVGHIYVDGGREIRPRRRFADDFFGTTAFLHAYAGGAGIACSSTVCIRRSTFRGGVVFPVGKKRGEDIYYWLRLGQLGPFAFSGRLVARIMREEQTGAYAARLSEIPYYIEWIAVAAPPESAEDRRALARILRTHVVQSALLAVQFGRRDYLARLSGVLRNHPALALLVRSFALVPSAAVRVSRRAVAVIRSQ